MAGMLQGQAQGFIETLKKSVREVRVTVSWKDGKDERSVSASQEMVILPESVGKAGEVQAQPPRRRRRSSDSRNWDSRRRRGWAAPPATGTRNDARLRVHAAGGAHRGGGVGPHRGLTWKSFDGAYSVKARVEQAEERDQMVRGSLGRLAREVSMSFLSEHYDRKRFRERPRSSACATGAARPT